MTPDQITELLDLYADDDLPTGLRTAVETHLVADPDAARDVHTLRATIIRLQAVPTERPDPWFVERTLDSLLHENAACPAVAAGRQ